MMRKLLDWRLFLVLAVIMGIIIYRPSLIPNAGLRVQAEKLRGIALNLPPLDSQRVAEAASGLRQQVLGLYDTAQKDKRIPGLPEQVAVDQYVGGLTNQIKALPDEQLKAVKRQFCQDVINEATQSGR
jgi:hypothetical protein